MTTSLFEEKLQEGRDKLVAVGYDKQDTLAAMSAVNTQLYEMYSLAGAIRRCKDCQFKSNCKTPVPGMGDTRATIMIVGESPGEDDMEIQAPFVGPSGQLLTIFLNKLGIDRRDVYVTNIIKCGGTKEMTFSEAQSCLHHFYNEIAIIKPKVIISMGSTTLKVLKDDKNAKITEERGNWFSDGILETLGIEIMPTYHPAYLFHTENKDTTKIKNQIWTDIKKAVHRAAQF